MLTEQDIKEITFNIENFCFDNCYSFDMSPTDIKTYCDKDIESRVYRFSTHMKYLTQPIQEQELLYSEPTSFWQLVKKLVGLKYKSKNIYLTEKLIYPNISIPMDKDKLRLYYQVDNYKYVAE